MRPFDRVIVADWSAAGSVSPARPSANAIWLGISDSAGTETRYFRSRASAEAYLAEFGKATETMTASVKDSFKPINERVSAAVEQFQGAR